MAKIKLTKTELKAQSDALKRFQRFLPMLQLKKQQLQAEIAEISAKADAVTAREQAARRALDSWVGLLATGGDMLSGLVKVKSVKTEVTGLTDCMKELTDESEALFAGNTIKKAYKADIKVTIQIEGSTATTDSLSVKMAYVDGQWYIADSSFSV